jgi:hypothetical protein
MKLLLGIAGAVASVGIAVVRSQWQRAEAFAHFLDDAPVPDITRWLWGQRIPPERQAWADELLAADIPIYGEPA